MFISELNLFLKEFVCPFEQIAHGSLNEATFNNKDTKLLIISYLSSELQAASMIAAENSNRQSTTSSSKVSKTFFSGKPSS
jgi:hypothetical protein